MSGWGTKRGGQWSVGLRGHWEHLHYNQNELRQYASELKSVNDEGSSDTIEKNKDFSNRVQFSHPYPTFEQLFLEKPLTAPTVEYLRKIFVLRAMVTRTNSWSQTSVGSDIRCYLSAGWPRRGGRSVFYLTIN